MREKEFNKLVDEVTERVSLRILSADWVCYKCGESSSILGRIEKLEQEAAKCVSTADAVEVVRCKDCDIRFDSCPMVVRVGNFVQIFTEDEDFCSRGRRKNDGTD